MGRTGARLLPPHSKAGECLEFVGVAVTSVVTQRWRRRNKSPLHPLFSALDRLNSCENCSGVKKSQTNGKIKRMEKGSKRTNPTKTRIVKFRIGLAGGKKNGIGRGETRAKIRDWKTMIQRHKNAR